MLILCVFFNIILFLIVMYTVFILLIKDDPHYLPKIIDYRITKEDEDYMKQPWYIIEYSHKTSKGIIWDCIVNPDRSLEPPRKLIFYTYEEAYTYLNKIKNRKRYFTLF